MSEKHQLRNLSMIYRNVEGVGAVHGELRAELADSNGEAMLTENLTFILGLIRDRDLDVEGVRVKKLEDAPFAGTSSVVTLAHYPERPTHSADNFRLSDVFLEGNEAGITHDKLYGQLFDAGGQLEFPIAPLEKVLVYIADNDLDVDGVRAVKDVSGSFVISLTKYPAADGGAA